MINKKVMLILAMALANYAYSQEVSNETKENKIVYTWNADYSTNYQLKRDKTLLIQQEIDQFGQLTKAIETTVKETAKTISRVCVENSNIVSVFNPNVPTAMLDLDIFTFCNSEGKIQMKNSFKIDYKTTEFKDLFSREETEQLNQLDKQLDSIALEISRKLTNIFLKNANLVETLNPDIPTLTLKLKIFTTRLLEEPEIITKSYLAT